MKKRAVQRPPIFPVHRINGTDIVPRCAECYKPCRTKPLPNGSFGIVSNAPVTGPKKEFTIGVNDWRWHNLKRCGGLFEEVGGVAHHQLKYLMRRSLRNAVTEHARAVNIHANAISEPQNILARGYFAARLPRPPPHRSL